MKLMFDSSESPENQNLQLRSFAFHVASYIHKRTVTANRKSATHRFTLDMRYSTASSAKSMPIITEVDRNKLSS